MFFSLDCNWNPKDKYFWSFIEISYENYIKFMTIKTDLIDFSNDCIYVGY